jgi:hypothetical protein
MNSDTERSHINVPVALAHTQRGHPILFRARVRQNWKAQGNSELRPTWRNVQSAMLPARKQRSHDKR